MTRSDTADLLLSGATSPAELERLSDACELVMVPLDVLDVSPDQNRESFDPGELEELARSIAELGLQQPVRVRRQGSRFVLVAGERRSRAYRLLADGLDGIDPAPFSAIPATVSVADDVSAALGTLAENLTRVDPSPLEETAGFARMVDVYGMTAADLARRLGISAERIRRRVGLLGLSDETRHFLASGQLPVGRAERMVGLDTNRQHLALAAHNEHVSTPVFGRLVDDLADQQAADSMFDPDCFMRVDTLVLEAEEAVAAESGPEVVREEPVGPIEVAAMLDVKRSTVHQWQQRRVMPPADLRVSGTPAWWRTTILEWAELTGRTPNRLLV